MWVLENPYESQSQVSLGIVSEHLLFTGMGEQRKRRVLLFMSLKIQLGYGGDSASHSRIP